MKGVEAIRYPVEGVTLHRIAAAQRSCGDGEEQAQPQPTVGPDAAINNNKPIQAEYTTTQEKNIPKTTKESDCEKNFERSKSESEKFSSEKTPTSVHKKTSHSEKSKCNKVLEVVKIANTLSRASVMSTPDDVFLNTPSDISSKKKFQITPKALLNTPQAHKSPSYSSWTSKSDTISTHKENEPKFVPYEPYKGCVKPIYKNRKTKKRSEKKDSSSCSQEKCISETNEKNISEKSITLSVEEVEKKSADRLAAVLRDFESERAKWEEEKHNLADTVALQEEQLCRLRKEKSQLEDQITVSAQVNSELKKLLVASVGEDVQGRVQVLTEDKARMATMIRRYSERVEKDFEEKQSMGIQCDVWRSKFMASSMLVDEMASLKVSFAKQMSEASEALKSMKDEHQAARQHVFNIYKMNKQLRDAFDPLAAQVGGSLPLTSADLVTLALDSNLMAECVRDHLLGDLGRAVGSQVKIDDLETCTPGEKMAQQVLERMTSSGMAFGLLECSTVSPGRGAMSSRFHPNVRFEHLTVNCCAHCNGEITVV